MTEALYRCPTPCDPDCEINGWGCHEAHGYPTHREHDPGECEARALAGNLRWLVDAGWMVTVARHRDPLHILEPYYARLAAEDREGHAWPGVSPGDVVAKAWNGQRQKASRRDNPGARICR